MINIPSINKTKTTSLILTITPRKLITILFTILSLTIINTIYLTNPGIRRSIQFWRSVSPHIIRYTSIKFKCYYIDGRRTMFLFSSSSSSLETKCDEGELNRRLSKFHEESAPHVVEIVMRLGGIYVKVGQMLSTMGIGLIDDAYVRALRPLQDGIPPRSYEEIKSIIEQSINQPLSSVFHTFSTKPIGSASIAQAHVATLLNHPHHHHHHQKVVVKVQYPEVATQFESDFDNVKRVIKYVLKQPKMMQILEILRIRHRNELDFRLEASNLRECAENMKRRGFEPNLIRLPRVFDGDGDDDDGIGLVVTKNVLVMEYLEGVQLADAIDEEYGMMANALGMKGGAEEFRERINDDLRRHFLNGGGGGGGGGGGNDAVNQEQEEEEKGVVGGNMKRGLVDSFVAKVGVGTLPLVRKYAVVCDRISTFMSTLGKLRLWRNNKVGDVLELPSPDTRRKQIRKVDIGKVLKTLIKVHGAQLLLDGVYNADPHPGNVIVMPDGKLGLIDYGMVGRLSLEERTNIANTLLGFATNNPQLVIHTYQSSGYHPTWSNGTKHHPDVIYRFAMFHHDRLNLAPITVGPNNEKMGVIDLLQRTIIPFAPDWVIQMERMGGLMIGLASQTGRPISLSKEWEGMAREFLMSNNNTTTTSSS